MAEIVSDHAVCDWSLLIPIKTSLFTNKSYSKSCDPIKKTPQKIQKNDNDRLRMRRGSSMSELDKISGGALPDLVRSTTANNRLAASPVSTPLTPHLSNCCVRGSIGDLMNQKMYGGSCWSSDTLVARTVPLSTVTGHKPAMSSLEPLSVVVVDSSTEEVEVSGPLTVAQRAQRLSRLIKQQRTTNVFKQVLVRSNNLVQFNNLDYLR